MDICENNYFSSINTYEKAYILGLIIFNIKDNCYDKIIVEINFNKEKIFFKEKGNCYEYCWNFFLEAYYFAQLTDNQVRIDEYFYKLFDFEHRKTRSELDMLTEIYKLFEQNLKK